ncbi:hypothetical protein GWC95_04795 [Sediminibacterium roseum]|uniref:Uncharacterized protein n=1 Tax=Sediminibacterium roseum TaxID=1978412 RepID=A0ABW9ZRT3_9BACT|nr:hypothetical protein [Sediminibacterium roseum]NCI49230.1 hypothetical protein [Sediminibacterium roseum]
MDGLKMEKWRTSFEMGVSGLKASYDSLLLHKRFEETFILKTDETSHTFNLELDPELPAEVQDRLEKLLIETEPEDSI